jgi:peptidase M23-like protein/cell shape-determining metallopeptidase Csd3-like protein
MAAVGAALLCMGTAPAIAEGFEPAPPAARGKSTLQIAPLSLGNPATAARLQTRPTAVPADAETAKRDSFRYRHPLTAKNGDTLTGLLVGAGVGRRDAVDAIDAMREIFDPRRIKPGHELMVTFERLTDEPEPGRFLGFSMVPEFSREVAVARNSDGGFEAQENERQLTRAPARASGRIDSSLYVDGEKAGVPVPVLIELIRAYSWDVDFQRDIWPGDSFEIMWQRVYDESGNLVHNGEILYANMTLTGTTHPIYRFAVEDGHFDYFNENGQSARKALMRTPIDGARLSSRYGKRKHPILGYTKMHRGVDFAAPKGTPIYAAGDGRIEVSGWNGAYGRYVRIRHNSEYSTAYGHMSRIARSAGKGKRVRQGQIIGYVGNTGRSTGAHLHYEIMRGGRQTNPLKVRMPSGRKLKGDMLARFQSARAAVDTMFASLTDETELAGTRD